jgi:hypothetical protein
MEADIRIGVREWSFREAPAAKAARRVGLSASPGLPSVNSPAAADAVGHHLRHRAAHLTDRSDHVIPASSAHPPQLLAVLATTAGWYRTSCCLLDSTAGSPLAPSPASAESVGAAVAGVELLSRAEWRCQTHALSHGLRDQAAILISI